MKNITMTLRVPNWAKWIAIDEDSRCFAFKCKPECRPLASYSN